MANITRMSAAAAAALCGLMAVGAAAHQAPDSPSTFRYRGRVVDAVIGAPIPGADVTFMMRGRAVKSAKTDEKGEYVLASATGACELLQFDLVGFVRESITDPTAGVFDVALNIGSLGQPEPIGVGWRGLVANADGTPAVDASVWLWRLGSDRVSGSRTDIEGTFTMPVGEFAGEFVLCARAAGERQRAACLTFDAGQPFAGDQPRLKLPPRAK